MLTIRQIGPHMARVEMDSSYAGSESPPPMAATNNPVYNTSGHPDSNPFDPAGIGMATGSQSQMPAEASLGVLPLAYKVGLTRLREVNGELASAGIPWDLIRAVVPLVIADLLAKKSLLQIIADVKAALNL